MPCIDEAIKDQVSSKQDQDQHQQEYVGTVETLQQLQQDFDSLTKQMVDGEGKSQKAHETTKQSIEILLEHIAYIRDQVDSKTSSGRHTICRMYRMSFPLCTESLLSSRQVSC